ncbi:suppressor of fused domain protein [Actinomadura alba]|uniref:Suppressor of fused domain protein n=1 Tax=Actinomadura alba TaxID=406431 RepID=A0ABR7LX52_9ACTN|nr:suppressor of fused domain protein [Actinomadura alba]MBC6469062.1 suppressor of fused domain protein [Actinomadura alba]
MNLIDHLESRLGRIMHGWSYNPDGRPMPFRVAECSGGELPNVNTYVTVGLSETHLPSRVSDKSIHQELMISVPSDQADGPYPALLQQIGCHLIREESALLRGDVVGPYGPILEGSPLEAFYASLPVHHDNDFAVVEPDEEGRAFAIALTWLIPISRSEADYVAKLGWDAFESELEHKQPDLLDPRRAEMALDF